MTTPWRRETPALPAQIEKVYFIGVCGTGMGSLAGMMRERGYAVSGSDTAIYPPMSDQLAAAGVEVWQGWDGDNIARANPDLVVVGNVCRKDNAELVAAQAQGRACLSFPEVLRLLFLEQAAQRLVVTGTHGKTTTATLLAWLLEAAGKKPSFMIGGITGNWGANYKLDSGDIFVVEGDEYDTACFDKVPKFFHYAPTSLMINNIEFDHADIYPSVEVIEGVFGEMLARLPRGAKVYANLDDVRVRRVCEARAEGVSVEGVGLGEGCGWRAVDIKAVEGGGVRFGVERQGVRVGEVESPLVGEHNVRNVLMAWAGSGGGEVEALNEALRGFGGVKKRQERVGEEAGVVIYDDFAHHPTAVRETVAGVRARHPKARLWGVFEAKSNTSRRAVFQEDYPRALALCDVVVLSSPWRRDDLPPEQLINLSRVVDDLGALGVSARLVPEVDEIVALVAKEARAGDVVLGMSGSAFGGFHRKLLEALRARGEEG
jgi:UDP-N-acetylmuramate: L-alanyl-gamma-D-glutamyl-meso-diaminopimelate ligase